MKISLFRRVFTTYMTIGTVFGTWLSPLITGMVLLILRILIVLSSIVDSIFFSRALKASLKKPIMIVGNPRSGTTFLHRYLVNSGIGTGSQLWQMLFPSISLQKIIKPFLPFLEKISPTRYHSNVAHVTSLQSIETDDAAIFFVLLMVFSIMVFFFPGLKKI